MFLPVMPTTVFLLIACWAFSRGSPRLHLRLYTRPEPGSGIRSLHRHRVIPRPAKALALASVAVNLAYATLFHFHGGIAPLVLAAVPAAPAVYILTWPS